MTQEERLRIIDRSDYDPYARMALVYMLLDTNKRATHVGLTIGTGPSARDSGTEAAREMVVGSFNAVRSLLDRLKLPYSIHAAPTEPENGLWSFSLHCVRNDEDLTRITEMEIDDEATHQEYGLMYGYPRTAAEAFSTPDALNREEYLEWRRNNQDLSTFAGFRPSRAHLQEEMEFIRRRRALIRQKCPRLYAQLQGGTGPWLRYYALRLLGAA